MAEMTAGELLEHALWVALSCYCERCDAEMADEIEHIDHVIDEDPPKWAKQVADIVSPLGWTSPDGWEMLCPDCSAKKGE